MALSGSLSTNKYSGPMGLKFSWTAGAQSIVDNTTPINWTLESDGGSGYSYYTGNLTLTIDGSTALSIPSKFLMDGGGAWKRTGTLTLKHNDDGKRSFGVSIAAGIYTYGAVNCTASTTFTIDQIKRRSVISGSDGTLGSSNTLTLTRYNSAFTDTITATCGTASMTIAAGNKASSVKWTPPVAWAAQNVSATSVTVTISCKTYSGSTLLGETTTTLTFAIPASVVPMVSLAVSDAKGYLAAYGSYIQNKSQAKVTASGEGVYGSTIKSYAIVCGSLSGTRASGTFDLPKSGTITIKVTATDSRGRSASASINIEVTAYSAPVAEITSRYRCDADGNEDYLGAYAIAVFNAAVPSLGGKNSASYALKYRIRGTTAWTSIAMDTLTGNYAPAVVSQMFPADIDYSYDICIETTDNFGTVESAYRTIQMGSPIMDADRNNRALAFFQRAVDADTIAFGEYVKFNAGTSLDGLGSDPLDAYPVGAIYISTVSTSPASLFGGTWTRLQNRFLLGAGSSYTAGATGGVSAVALTVDQIPSHTHIQAHAQIGASGSATWVIKSDGTGQTQTTATGGGKSHTNMPPYLVVYMWKRTA